MDTRTLPIFFWDTGKTLANTAPSLEQLTKMEEERVALNEHYNLGIPVLPDSPSQEDISSLQITLVFGQAIVDSAEKLKKLIARRENAHSGRGKAPETVDFYRVFLKLLKSYITYLKEKPSDADILININICNNLLEPVNKNWEEASQKYFTTSSKLPLLAAGSTEPTYQTLQNLEKSTEVVFAELYCAVKDFKAKRNTLFYQSHSEDSNLRKRLVSEKGPLDPKIEDQYQNFINIFKTKAIEIFETTCDRSKPLEHNIYLNTTNEIKKEPEVEEELDDGLDRVTKLLTSLMSGTINKIQGETDGEFEALDGQRNSLDEDPYTNTLKHFRREMEDALIQNYLDLHSGLYFTEIDKKYLYTIQTFKNKAIKACIAAFDRAKLLNCDEGINTIHTYKEAMLRELETLSERTKPLGHDAYINAMRNFKQNARETLQIIYSKITELSIKLYSDLSEAENRVDNQSKEAFQPLKKLLKQSEKLIVDLNQTLAIQGKDQSLKTDNKSYLTRHLSKLDTFEAWKLTQQSSKRKDNEDKDVAITLKRTRY